MNSIRYIIISLYIYIYIYIFVYPFIIQTYKEIQTLAYLLYFGSTARRLIYVSLSPFLHRSVCLPVRLPVLTLVLSSVYLSVHTSVCSTDRRIHIPQSSSSPLRSASVFSFVNFLTVRLSVYLTVCLDFCPSLSRREVENLLLNSDCPTVHRSSTSVPHPPSPARFPTIHTSVRPSGRSGVGASDVYGGKSLRVSGVWS